MHDDGVPTPDELAFLQELKRKSDVQKQSEAQVQAAKLSKDLRRQYGRLGH